MNDKDIEKAIKNEFDIAVPDDLDAILARCEAEVWNDAGPEPAPAQKPATIVKIPRKKPRFLAAAAVLVVLIGASFSYVSVKTPTDYIQIDVNPSIELTLNMYGRVLDCTPINSDADPIVGSFSIDGQTISDSVGKIAAALVKANYINENSNSVLVSAMGKNQARAEKFAAAAAQAVNDTVSEKGVKPSVISQHFTVSDKETDDAGRYSISCGKAALIHALAQKMPEYNAANLAKLNISALDLLVDEYAKDSVAQTGTVSGANYITKADAIKKAQAFWAYSGIDAGDAAARMSAWSTGLIYVVTAQSGSRQHVCVLDAATGKVLTNEVAQSSAQSTQSGGKTQTTAPAVSEPAASAPVSKPSDTTPTTEPASDTNITAGAAASGVIGSDRALVIAENAAGVDPAAVKDANVDLVTQNGVKVYRVKFEVGELDYKVYVNPRDGAVLSMKVY